MATLKDWLRTIAFALNDDEPTRPFQRYSLKDMIAAYNAAICLEVQYRPDLFTELRIVQLSPGRHQDIRGCCAQVLDVLEQTDKQGNVIRLIKGARQRPTMVKRNWKKASCLPVADGQTYVVENVDIDKNLNGRFAIDPPVPCAIKAYVTVKCVPQPCAKVEADVEMEVTTDCTSMTAAWHYVLATMLAGDQFANAAAGGDRKYHYTMFFNILGVVQKQEDRIESKEQA